MCESEYPTISSIPRTVKNLIFDSGCYANIPELTLSGFSILESITFKTNSFNNTHTAYIESSTVTSITFESNTFNGNSNDGSLTLYTSVLVSCTIKSNALTKIKTIYLRELTKSVTWTLSRPSCTSVSYIKYYGVATLIPMRILWCGNSYSNETNVCYQNQRR